MSYNKDNAYITQAQHEEIVQRINDCYSDEYLTGTEYIMIYNSMLDEYIHLEDDELFIYNNY